MAEANSDQAAFWGGDAGDTWVTQQAQMDRLLTPVLDELLARASLSAGQSVLDVGCGTGQSTIAAGQIVGPQGHVVGADISDPMLALARNRSSGMDQVSYVSADVADHAFEAGQFDHVISRFGVMFFADTLVAFTNLAKAMKPGGTMTFATWGRIEANPWFTMPARIGKELFGPVPKTDPDAPGPFALRDIAKVTDILGAAGLNNVQGVAVDLMLSLPGGAREIAQLSCHIGPAARTLGHFEVDDAGQLKLEDAMTAAFGSLPDHTVPAEINFFSCTA